ncbi:MAG: hypothetical protein IEMM0008_1828 [bacterium]|nr:MAG: hypothetical protein IEMM0008_1828 [bacterium]
MGKEAGRPIPTDRGKYTMTLLLDEAIRDFMSNDKTDKIA